MSPSFELPLYHVARWQWHREWPSEVVHLRLRALLCSSVTKHFISSSVWSREARGAEDSMPSLNWKHYMEGLKWNKTTDFGGVSNTEAGYLDSWNVTTIVGHHGRDVHHGVCSPFKMDWNHLNYYWPNTCKATEFPWQHQCWHPSLMSYFSAKMLNIVNIVCVHAHFTFAH